MKEYRVTRVGLSAYYLLLLTYYYRILCVGATFAYAETSSHVAIIREHLT